MIVVSGSFADRNNRNKWIAGNLAKGFAEIVGGSSVRLASFDAVMLAIETERPQLLIMVGSPAALESDFREVAALCRKTQTCFAFWTVEDPYESDFNFRFESLADIVFTNDAASVEYYRRGDVHHLPLATSAAIRKDLGDYEDRLTDVFFCGVAFPVRQVLINDLLPVLTRYRTSVLGDGWPSSVSSIAENRRINFDALIRAYQASRIVLNVGRDLSQANSRHIKPTTPGPRTFDAAMAGCVQLYYRPGPRIADYFAPDLEILTFETVREGEELINATLSDPHGAVRIAQASQDRALRDHTYAHRAQRILQMTTRKGGPPAEAGPTPQPLDPRAANTTTLASQRGPDAGLVVGPATLGMD